MYFPVSNTLVDEYEHISDNWASAKFFAAELDDKLVAFIGWRWYLVFVTFSGPKTREYVWGERFFIHKN